MAMDRATIEELFTFTEYSWREHEGVIRPLGDGKLTEPAPGSDWPALRDALVHINWAYVRWLADPARTAVVREDATTDVTLAARRGFDLLLQHRHPGPHVLHADEREDERNHQRSHAAHLDEFEADGDLGRAPRRLEREGVRVVPFL